MVRVCNGGVQQIVRLHVPLVNHHVALRGLAGRPPAASGSRAENTAGWLMKSVKRSDRGLSIATDPHSPCGGGGRLRNPELHRGRLVVMEEERRVDGVRVEGKGSPPRPRPVRPLSPVEPDRIRSDVRKHAPVHRFAHRVPEDDGEPRPIFPCLPPRPPVAQEAAPLSGPQAFRHGMKALPLSTIQGAAVGRITSLYGREPPALPIQSRKEPAAALLRDGQGDEQRIDGLVTCAGGEGEGGSRAG